MLSNGDSSCIAALSAQYEGYIQKADRAVDDILATADELVDDGPDTVPAVLNAAIKGWLAARQDLAAAQHALRSLRRGGVAPGGAPRPRQRRPSPHTRQTRRRPTARPWRSMPSFRLRWRGAPGPSTGGSPSSRPG